MQAHLPAKMGKIELIWASLVGFGHN